MSEYVESFYKNTLGLEAQKTIRAATKKYIADILAIYPRGSWWTCYHGSKNGYTVEIVDMYSDRGLTVINVDTGKRKTVSWASLGNRV